MYQGGIDEDVLKDDELLNKCIELNIEDNLPMIQKSKYSKGRA